MNRSCWFSHPGRRHSRRVAAAAAGGLALGLLPAPPAAATHHRVTTMVSVDSAGGQDLQSQKGSGAPVVSADGRFVVFESGDRLVAGDTNGGGDVFVHDRHSGATTRASVASDGAQANGSSFGAAISADGRFVAFTSLATNLVGGDTNAKHDVFVHDRDADADAVFDEAGAVATTRVSVASDGAQANGDTTAAAISADGRFVAFESVATNLVSLDTNSRDDVFVHDRDADGDAVFDEAGAVRTHRVSMSTLGLQASAPSRAPAVSADGRFVAFQSHANNLVDGDTNNSEDVFVHDRDADENNVFDEASPLVVGSPPATTTTRVSVASGGGQASSFSTDASISADGQVVSFVSFATNLVEGDTNGERDAFVHHRATRTTTRVSVASGGAQAKGASFDATLSPDGGLVAFTSFATNLVGGDTNLAADVFVHDRATAATTRQSVDGSGVEGNQGSGAAALSDQGVVVAFASAASNLDLRDANRVQDVFARAPAHHRATSLAFTPASATSAQHSDAVVIQARLADEDGTAIAGEMVAFKLSGPAGSRGVAASTDAQGLATATVTVTEAPGGYDLKATYAGAATYDPTATTMGFLVEKEDTATGLTVEGNPGKRELVARLADLDAGTGIAGRTIRFLANGVDIGSATTAADGTARLSPPAKYQKGKQLFTAIFAGDAYYWDSKATAAT